MPEDETLMTKDEVAKLFRVDAGTVARWVADRRLTAVRTPGGGIRFNRLYIRGLVGTEGDPSREG